MKLPEVPYFATQRGLGRPASSRRRRALSAYGLAVPAGSPSHVMQSTARGEHNSHLSTAQPEFFRMVVPPVRRDRERGAHGQLGQPFRRR